MDSKDKRYSYDRFGKKGARVGQAILDMEAKPQYRQEVGETVEEMTQKYYDGLIEAATLGKKEFDSPFYVVILRKKETINGQIVNVLRHKYIRRQTKPSAKFLREEFSNSDHDVYEVNGNDLSINYLWTLPTKQDAKTIMKNPDLYDERLVGWIKDFNSGKLS